MIRTNFGGTIAAPDFFMDHFPAKITAVTLGTGNFDGIFLYDWIEQSFDVDTGLFVDEPGTPRQGTADPLLSPAMEYNNAQVPVPQIVMMRFQGNSGGQAIFKFYSAAAAQDTVLFGRIVGSPDAATFNPCSNDSNGYSGQLMFPYQVQIVGFNSTTVPGPLNGGFLPLWFDTNPWLDAIPPDGIGILAYEESGNRAVPVDGTVIVELRQGIINDGVSGSSMLFKYDAPSKFALLTNEDKNGQYGWIEAIPNKGQWLVGGANTSQAHFAPGGGGMPGEAFGTSTLNYATELNAGSGLAGNFVRMWRGHCSGYAQAATSITTLGDGVSTNEVQTLQILNAIGGNYDLYVDVSDPRGEPANQGFIIPVYAIPWNADPSLVQSMIQTALNGFNNVPGSNNVTVSVTGTPALGPTSCGSAETAGVYQITMSGTFPYRVIQTDSTFLQNDQTWLFSLPNGGPSSSIPIISDVICSSDGTLQVWMQLQTLSNGVLSLSPPFHAHDAGCCDCSATTTTSTTTTTTAAPTTTTTTTGTSTSTSTTTTTTTTTVKPPTTTTTKTQPPKNWYCATVPNPNNQTCDVGAASICQQECLLTDPISMAHMLSTGMVVSYFQVSTQAADPLGTQCGIQCFQNWYCIKAGGVSTCQYLNLNQLPAGSTYVSGPHYNYGACTITGCGASTSTTTTTTTIH